MWIRRGAPGSSILGAQVADVDIHDVGRPSVLVPPYLAEQRFPTEHDARVAHEVGEEIELGLGEVDALPGPANAPSTHIEGEVATLEQRRWGEGLARAQPRPQAGQQFLDRKGLDQIVVGAGVEAGHPIRHGVARGDQDDRSWLGGLESPADFQTADTGEQHIQQRDIPLPVQGQSQAGQAVAGQLDLVTLVQQFQFKVPSQRGVVLDNQDPPCLRHRRTPRHQLDSTRIPMRDFSLGEGVEQTGKAARGHRGGSLAPGGPGRDLVQAVRPRPLGMVHPLRPTRRHR